MEHLAVEGPKTTAKRRHASVCLQTTPIRRFQQRKRGHSLSSAEKLMEGSPAGRFKQAVWLSMCLAVDIHARPRSSGRILHEIGQVAVADPATPENVVKHVFSEITYTHRTQQGEKKQWRCLWSTSYWDRALSGGTSLAWAVTLDMRTRATCRDPTLLAMGHVAAEDPATAENRGQGRVFRQQY